MSQPTIDPATCPHPARRLYSWIAFDGVLCVACCDCGTPLRGACAGPEAWDAEQRALDPRPTLRMIDDLDATWRPPGRYADDDEPPF